MTPDAVRLQSALQHSEPLVRLRALLQESQARYATIRPALPGSLAEHLSPGPVDETGWSLLARNASVAAKVRQLQPRLEALLLEGGWANCTIRVKVQAA